jgi:threonine/homoserine/homoserine lactone efflux protein
MTILARYLRMQDLVLATIALSGCAFLIYVFFQWLRQELNPQESAETRATIYFR